MASGRGWSNPPAETHVADGNSSGVADAASERRDGERMDTLDQSESSGARMKNHPRHEAISELFT